MSEILSCFASSTYPSETSLLPHPVWVYSLSTLKTLLVVFPVFQTHHRSVPNTCVIEKLGVYPLLNFLNVVFKRQRNFPILTGSVDKIFITKNVLNPMCAFPERVDFLLLSGIRIKNKMCSKRPGLPTRQNLGTWIFQNYFLFVSLKDKMLGRTLSTSYLPCGFPKWNFLQFHWDCNASSAGEKTNVSYFSQRGTTEL